MVITAARALPIAVLKSWQCVVTHHVPFLPGLKTPYYVARYIFFFNPSLSLPSIPSLDLFCPLLGLAVFSISLFYYSLLFKFVSLYGTISSCRV